MTFFQYVRGACRLRLTGAAPHDCINALARDGISFWELSRENELCYCITVHAKQEKRVQEVAQRAFCDVECLSSYGMVQDLKRGIKRPVLLVGVVLALVLSFYLQSYVWVIEIDGCDTLKDQEILQALQEIGVHVGGRARDYDMKQLRHELLIRLPQLSWVAVNRSGGRLCVLACGRQASQEQQPYPAADLISVRDGVVTELNVLEGMRLCAVGQTVSEGQILVSGVEDYGLYMKGVCAEGEIYGQTWHSGTVVCPSETMEKCFTGREWTQRTLILGRKRINLSGNSSFSGVVCDKIISTKQFTLPGYAFPLILETAHYREYTLQPVARQPQEAEMSLENTWRHDLLSAMVAGKIEQTETTCYESGGLYILQARSTCNELLSRLRPMQAPYEGES